MNFKTQTSPQQVDLILKGRVILTMDSNRRTQNNAALSIKNGRIIAIDQASEIEKQFISKKVIDTGESVILPGFVDVHAHTPQTLIRGVYDGKYRGNFFIPFLLFNQMTPEHTRIFGLVGCIEAISSGTTMMQVSMNQMDAFAQAVEMSGLRANITEEIANIDYEQATYGQHLEVPGQAERMFDQAKNIVTKWQGKANGRITTGFAPLAADCLSPEIYQQIAIEAKKNNLLITTHVAQSQKEVDFVQKNYKTTPVKFLKQNGVLGKRTIAAHCRFISSEDAELIKNSKTSIAHHARGFLSYGMVLPLADWLNQGIKVGLGTDDVHHNMWRTMRATFDASAVRANQENRDDLWLSNHKILELATIGGAKALDMDNDIGSIEIGKKADLQVIDLENPKLTPTLDLESSLVMFGDTDCVKMVMIDGKIVHGPESEIEVDIKSVVREAQKMADELWREILKQNPKFASDYVKWTR